MPSVDRVKLSAAISGLELQQLLAPQWFEERRAGSDATDQLLDPSQTLLSEGGAVALHADLQWIHQVAGVTVDGTALDGGGAATSSKGVAVFAFPAVGECEKVPLTAVLTLVRYSSWFPPLLVVGRAMVRCSRLTGKIPVETFESTMSLVTCFLPADAGRWAIVRGMGRELTLTVKLNSGPMSSRVLTAVISGVDASAT